ncbi:hypothetical protein EAH57_15065 [Acinetobacter sp. 2JN-4]|nr:hypothetical protein EAH57_15065 [Acinetobacter sp. 2JN-4]
MKFVNCQGCEQRREWLHEQARKSSESIKRAINALTGAGTKQSDPEPTPTVAAKPKRSDRNNQNVSTD